ncbi:MAG: transcriptional regulator [Planctomycetes bacterium RIFCSPHIGHO2_02_FULL_50_42]|nr:MAG: transcriptional regulator [Planctomycetes bacterium GWA2_50_13]OHB87510.1 MAG: transcriptional regulator [Planctomycetes bacterium RIFCSPHIGHO2_02_FULL_50_42]OHB91462.1 MAG: transcriptional regulator [Planctomycetes bacterium RIFCSPHIGHO2_12_FULL_51_37]OHB95966.1 MAG: transcriptional regulator [Planctomycetes bacterium RIFCSPLOWO2_02_FULL_50_16]OHC02428.1 MAG: transcriptional regulator [Planctomycetes bacterium RIFCSPLOWO2_12_FULL_50_35]HCN19084.1 transcriptional regulator [Planctomyce
MTRPKILVVEDDKNSLSGLLTLLQHEGYETSGAISAYEALALMDTRHYDIVLADMKLPGLGALSLIEEIRKKDSDIPVVVMTAYSSVENAVAAIKKGAEEYLTKPLDIGALKRTLKNLRERQQLLKDNEALRTRLEKKQPFPEFVGSTPEMHKIFETIRDVAPSTATVLIYGETGVGKEMVAQAIHQSSKRKNGPFVVLHCAALAEGVLESELFGHDKGSFTGALYTRKGRFELAHQGTLFLDEISEMSLQVQVKLLRVVETCQFERVGGEATKEVDVRLVAATNKDLLKEVSEGRFREDLYYRINVININIPPLRERKADIPLLVDYFVIRYVQKNNKDIKGVSPEAMKLLKDYNWPGNVRELENTIERAVVLSKKDVIEPEHLPPNLAPRNDSITPSLQVRIGTSLKDVEKEVIMKTLELTGGNKTDAAKLLGVSTRKIEYKVKEWEGRD